MTQIHHYSSPTTPAGAGFDTIISNAVQVDPSHSFSERASLGDAAIVGVNVDDPEAAYEFAGLKRWYVIENACPSGDQLAWTGYIGTQTISRGSGDTLFPTDDGRQWDLELVEVNVILGFRVITGEDGDRPAETAGERLTWLLAASDYLTTVGDNGLVVYPDDEMDENDYRGQTAKDVLDDLALETGHVFFVFYDKDADDDQRISLFFDDPNSLSYTSDLRISNYAADVDDSTTFAPTLDARLEGRPDRVTAGAYVQYSGGAVYEFDLETSYEFGFRDQVAPVPEVKTEAKALALADRFLEDNDEQDYRAFCRIEGLPAAKLNDVKRGQAMQARFRHFRAPYNDWTWWRVIDKAWAPPENRSQLKYDVDLELSPITPPGEGIGQAFAHFVPGNPIYATPVLDAPTTPGNLLLMVTAQAAIISGVAVPTVPTFYRDPVISPPNAGTLDTGWTTAGFAVADSATPGQQRIAYGIFWRLVADGETTVTPVAVQPEPEEDFDIGVWLYELEGVTVGSATTYTTDTDGVKDEGEAIVVGSVMTGFVFGGFCVGVPDSGHRLTITAIEGETLQSETSVGDDSAPVASPAGMDPPWTWIAQLPGGGRLRGSYTAPFDVYTNRAVAGVAVVLEGLDADSDMPTI